MPPYRALWLSGWSIGCWKSITSHVFPWVMYMIWLVYFMFIESTSYGKIPAFLCSCLDILSPQLFIQINKDIFHESTAICASSVEYLGYFVLIVIFSHDNKHIFGHVNWTPLLADNNEISIPMTPCRHLNGNVLIWNSKILRHSSGPLERPLHSYFYYRRPNFTLVLCNRDVDFFKNIHT